MRECYAIDFGSKNICIYKKGCGVVLKEPAACLITTVNKEITSILFGKDALKNVGNINQTTKLIYPIKNGVIQEKYYGFCRQMLEYFFSKIKSQEKSNSVVEFLVVASCGLTEKEYNSIRKICYELGADIVNFAPASICGLLGSGVNLQSCGSIASFDLGADKSTISIVNNFKVIDAISENIGGNFIDTKIKEFCLENFRLDISLFQAEEIKNSIASLVEGDIASFEIIAQNIDTHSIENKIITAKEIRFILVEIFTQFAICLKEMLEKVFDDNAKLQVARNGIIIYGDLAKVTGVERFFQDLLKVPVKIIKKSNCNIIGAGIILENKKILKLI